MSKKQNLLDVPSIQKGISNKHKKFIKEYGLEIEKVTSDHRLMVDIMMAKLHRIILIFKDEQVIDNVTIIDEGSHRKIILSKNGYDTNVSIVTNGSAVAFEGVNMDNRWPSEKIIVEDIETFDWVDFSMGLLDYIHSTIYQRKEVIETKLFKS
jgi:hypothetical protein